MDLSLMGCIGVVTGASSGIGAAVARRLAEEGVRVAMCARRRQPLDDVAGEIRARGGEAVAIPADTGSPEDVARLMATVAEQLGGIDLLVNNAGATVFASLEEIPDDRWMADLNVKLLGYVRCLRAALSYLRASDSACVVNVGGNAGRQPLPYHLPGGAANAGLLNFTQAMGQYLGSEDIRVVGVAPGLVNTPRLNKQLKAQADLWGVTPEEARERMVEQIPLRRIAVPEDVADLVCFLLSDRARMITGTTITLDGGSTRGI